MIYQVWGGNYIYRCLPESLDFYYKISTTTDQRNASHVNEIGIKFAQELSKYNFNFELNELNQ